MCGNKKSNPNNSINPVTNTGTNNSINNNKTGRNVVNVMQNNAIVSNRSGGDNQNRNNLPISPLMPSSDNRSNSTANPSAPTNDQTNSIYPVLHFPIAEINNDNDTNDVEYRLPSPLPTYNNIASNSKNQIEIDYN